jgi:predicted type IV restriction endonuclease
MSSLQTTVEAVVKRIRELSKSGFNEQNTAVVLVEPVLAALGWDVHDPAVVDRQYRVYDGTRLDYALKLDGRPALFLEVKALGENLDDPRFISQAVNYANNEGVL